MIFLRQEFGAMVREGKSSIVVGLLLPEEGEREDPRVFLTIQGDGEKGRRKGVMMRLPVASELSSIVRMLAAISKLGEERSLELAYWRNSKLLLRSGLDSVEMILRDEEGEIGARFSSMNAAFVAALLDFSISRAISVGARIGEKTEEKQES